MDYPQPLGCGDACDAADNIRTPGPVGATGSAGESGDNGVSAITLTTEAFTVPAVDANVTVPVANSSWMIPGELVFVQNAGYYQVVSAPTNASVTIKNLGYTGNATPATVIAALQKVGPTGPKGLDVTVLSGTGNLTFGAVAATGGTSDQTIAVVGAVVGDTVSLGTPAAPDAGIVYFAFVSAVDTVTVRATNTTAAPITPAAGSAFSVKVHQ